MKYPGGPLGNQTWQTEWKTASLVKVQVCEYENWTLEVFVVVSRLYDKFDCPVAHQNISFLTTARVCETDLLDSKLSSQNFILYSNFFEVSCSQWPVIRY